jgi:CheY-like chemotaxis protein
MTSDTLARTMSSKRRMKVTAQPRRLAEPSRQKRVTRVLIAHTDKLILASYCEWLASQGFTVTTAHTPTKCLSALREALPDVLVLEAELSLGPVEAYLSLQANETDLARIPLIVLCNRPNPNACASLAALFPLSERYQKALPPITLHERICHLLAIIRGENPPVINAAVAAVNGSPAPAVKVDGQ